MKKGIVLRICDFVKTFNREGSHRVFSLPEWDGNDHVGALFRRLPGVTDEMVGFLAIWIRSSVVKALRLFLPMWDTIPYRQRSGRYCSLHLKIHYL